MAVLVVLVVSVGGVGDIGRVGRVAVLMFGMGFAKSWGKVSFSC